MIPYILHLPSLRVTITMPLKYAPNAQWCITDYPNTEEATEDYISFLIGKLTRRQNELDDMARSNTLDDDIEYSDETFIFRNLVPIDEAVWGREVYKGSSMKAFSGEMTMREAYMPVVMDDIPTIRRVLADERKGNNITDTSAG